ncbi:MAG: hypothetical protein WAM28_03200 [Chlamydiales bacterium]
MFLNAFRQLEARIQSDSKTTKIAETMQTIEAIVGLPNTFEKHSLSDMKALLRHTFVTLNPLGNSYKLYVHTRGRGGLPPPLNESQNRNEERERLEIERDRLEIERERLGLERERLGFERERAERERIERERAERERLERHIFALSDHDLAWYIYRKLPRNTFDIVRVSTIDYDFSRLGQTTRARSITIELSRDKVVRPFFYALFAGLGLYPNGNEDFRRINEETLKRELIANLFEGTQQSNEIRRAYSQASTICLFIALDRSRIELQLSNSCLVLGVYNVTYCMRNSSVLFRPILALAR